MNVGSILARKGREIATADASISLRAAARMMSERNIGSLVLVDGDGELAGIISERDIVRAMADAGEAAAALPVSRFMTADVCTCSPETLTGELMQLMTERRFRHLPVVDGEGRMIGIVSIGDVVLQRMKEMAFEAEQMKQYIASG